MKIKDAVQVHKDLHAGKIGITRFDATRDFRTFRDGPLSFVTQNMRKPGSNTNWVRAESGRLLTWIFKNGDYHGKIRTFKNKEGSIITEAYKLNPERVVYTEERQ